MGQNTPIHSGAPAPKHSPNRSGRGSDSFLRAEAKPLRFPPATRGPLRLLSPPTCGAWRFGTKQLPQPYLGPESYVGLRTLLSWVEPVKTSTTTVSSPCEVPASSAAATPASPGSRARRPAQSVSAARQPVEGAHHARPNLVERPCGGYMIGGGTFGGGFMLGSGN